MIRVCIMDHAVLTLLETGSAIVRMDGLDGRVIMVCNHNFCPRDSGPM